MYQVFLRHATERSRPSRTISVEAATHPVAPDGRPLHPVLQAQRVLGNRAVRQFLASRPSINRSLAFERQVDRIARKQPPSPETASDTESTGDAAARQSHVTTAAAWLVSDPAEWETSRVATLDTGDAIDVIDLATSASFNRCDEEYRWWKVKVLTGRAKDSVGWVMRAFLTENRTQPDDAMIWAAVQGLVADGEHLEAIELVIREYLIDKRDAVFKYAPGLKFAGQTLGNRDPIIVLIGPTAFASLARLVRVIVHELEHVRQVEVGIGSGSHEDDLGQFLSECAEMTTVGVPDYTFDEFMEAADLASRFWWALHHTPAGRALQEEHWDTFVATRKVIRSRWAEADPKSRTQKYADIVNWWSAERHPGPPPLP